MSSDHSINLHSLGVVRDELTATIESAARDLEVFVSSNQEDAEALQASINGVQQISGILKVLELESATVLAEELLKVSNEIPTGSNGKNFDKKMEVVSNTFFILTRYLEYLQQVKYQVPVLLIPHINALRKLRQETVLPESHFVHISLPSGFSIRPEVEGQDPASIPLQEFRRIRHMYQIGLTGLLREKQLKNSTSLMRRSVKKLLNIGGSDQPLSQLWWLADICLDAMIACHMSPLESRKFLFMRLDKIIRQLAEKGGKAYSAAPPKGLLKELLYLIALSNHKTKEAEYVRSISKSLELPYSEADLQKEFATLYGPSSHTISSLAYVLQNEISNAKKTLESAAQSASGSIDDVASFRSALTNISEILFVVGLRSASTSLKEQLEVVALWENTEHHIGQDEMNGVANTLLYIESTIQGLESTDIPEDYDGNDTDAHRQQKQIASHELATAIQIVIEECLGGLALAKRGINSFSDSNYDVGHIKNIAKTLNSIRGAMSMMRHERAEQALANSSDFVEEVLLGPNPPAAINELLETFADVIIAIEYYFDSADGGGNMDSSVLRVAEESLSALGYPVNA